MRRSSALIAAAALGWTTPAATQSADEDYRAGVSARLGGDADAALTRLTRAAATEPDNSDIHLQLGLAQLALDRLDAAETSFRRTLALAPDYVDARIGLARVALRRGDRDSARAELEVVRADNEEAIALRRLLDAPGESPPWRWTIDLDGAWSAVEQAADWQERAFAVRHRPIASTTVSGTVEWARRFRAEDVHAEARLDHRFSPGASAWLLVGATPDADFRPEWQIGAGGALRVRSGGTGTMLRIDGRHAEYSAGDVQLLTPGVEQYFADGRAWLTGQWINVFEDGRHESGWLVRGDWMPDGGTRLFAGLSEAPDLSEGVVVESFSVFGGVAIDIGRRATLRLSLAHEDRASGADRLTTALGLGTRF